MLAVVVVIVVSALLQSYVIQVYEIPSGSVECTLRGGDKVAMPMYDSDDVERGDIIVFSDPNDWLHVKEPAGPYGVTRRLVVSVDLLPGNTGRHLVKRVVGVGGDHVAADGKGTLSVSNVVIKESYIKDGQSLSLTSFDVTVPQGYVQITGDDRSNSADSRYHRDDVHGGSVPLRNVIGVARMIFQRTHLSRWGLLQGGEYAFSDVLMQETTPPASPSSPVAPTSDGEMDPEEEIPSPAPEGRDSDDIGTGGEGTGVNDGPQTGSGGPADSPSVSAHSSDQERTIGRTR